MKRILRLLFLTIVAICTFASCNDSKVTVDDLNGKTPYELYHAAVSHFNNYSSEGSPYSINFAWTPGADSKETYDITLSYESDAINYSYTKSDKQTIESESIVYLNGDMYYIDNEGGKHYHTTERDDVIGYITESTVVKELTPALPHDLPEEWFEELSFNTNKNGAHNFTIDIDEKKSKKHPTHSDFYRKDVKIKVFFTKDGLLEQIELTNVVVGGKNSKLVVSFSWELPEAIKAPADKDEYLDKGEFDHHKGHKPGGAYGEHVHSFNSSIIISESTCTKHGIRESFCSCGERNLEFTFAPGHNMVNDFCSNCNRTYSTGLEFISYGNGTCCVISIGTCADADIIIPPISPDGDSVITIGSQAFEECTQITNITIPKSVKIIEQSAFSRCSRLETIAIPEGVTDIGEYAFFYCETIRYIEIPQGITSIGRNSFYQCKNLLAINIPASVTSIGIDAFGFCTSLQEINVDSNNQQYASIEGNIYNKDCTTLIKYAIGKTATKFTIPESVTVIESNAFSSALSLINIEIPDSVVAIGSAAFYNCTSLTSIAIPKNVTTIEDNTFRSCKSLKSILIPKSITSIGFEAFYYCLVDDVYYMGTEEEWAAISRSQELGYATIHYNYVPEE